MNLRRGTKSLRDSLFDIFWTLCSHKQVILCEKGAAQTYWDDISCNYLFCRKLCNPLGPFIAWNLFIQSRYKFELYIFLGIIYMRCPMPINSIYFNMDELHDRISNTLDKVMINTKIGHSLREGQRFQNLAIFNLTHDF